MKYDSFASIYELPSVLWCCSLAIREGIKTEWWGAGMVICLEQGADLHMAQLTTATHCLLLQWNPDWFYLSGTGSPDSPGQKAVKRVCVRACVRASVPSVYGSKRAKIKYTSNVWIITFTVQPNSGFEGNNYENRTSWFYCDFPNISKNLTWFSDFLPWFSCSPNGNVLQLFVVEVLHGSRSR